jgi:hypothetical protein
MTKHFIDEVPRSIPKYIVVIIQSLNQFTISTIIYLMIKFYNE